MSVFAPGGIADKRLTRRQDNPVARKVRDNFCNGHRTVVGDHFECQRRDPVTIFGQVHIFENGQRQTAIGRCPVIGFRTGHQPVDGLVLATRVKGKSGCRLEIAGDTPEDFSVRPYPADALDSATGQGNGETGRIAINCRARLAFPSAFPVAGLFEISRPDHRPRDPHPTKYPGNLGAIARRLDGQFLQPRPFPPLWLEQDILVELLADYGTDSTADRPANCGAYGGQHQGRHSVLRQSENRDNWPRGLAGTKHDLAKTGMGVNKAIIGADQKMPLDGTGPDQNDVAFT